MSHTDETDVQERYAFLQREANPQIGDIYGCSGSGHVIMLLSVEDDWTGGAGYIREYIWTYCDLEGTERNGYDSLYSRVGKRIKCSLLHRRYDLLFPFDLEENPAKVDP